MAASSFLDAKEGLYAGVSCPQVGQPASRITTDANQRAAVPKYTAKTTETPFIRGFPRNRL